MPFRNVNPFGGLLLITALLITALLTAACQPPQPAQTVAPPAPTSPPPASATTPPTPTPAPTASATPPPAAYCSPLAVQPLESLSEIITQPFLMPRVLEDGSYKDDGHHGVDLGFYTRNKQPFTGTPVLSALTGRIAAILHDRPPYGNAILIETPFEQIPPQTIARQNIPAGNSLYSLYAHLQNLQPLNLGQPVSCGQQIAESGLTGFTGGPHLHFEMRWGPAGTTFPAEMAYYRADTSAEERSNYETWRMSGKFHLFNPMTELY